jgi:hypothetical protein
MQTAACRVSWLLTCNRVFARSALLLVALLAGVLWRPQRGHAQANQFGGQDRADAARQMIVLGVQQGISSLPPMSGQAFSYEFDPARDTYVRSKQLGPTSFRAPQTVGAGNLSVRFATSYFELADSLSPIPYRIKTDEPPPGGTQRLDSVALFGLSANAKVGLVNLAANYGFTNRFEVMLNLPVVIVDAHASQVFSSSRSGLYLPPNGSHVFSAPVFNNDVGKALQTLDNALKPGGPLVLRQETFSDLGFAFNDGTHVGVGRIDIGAKGVLYSGTRAQLAFAPEFFFPSPNEAEFAGSDSAAILPRLVGAVTVSRLLKLHVDAGYDFDFDHDELRRVVWNAGASIPGPSVTFDFGLGGSKFNQGIQWTPPVVHGARIQTFPPSTATALGDVRLGDNFVDFLGGFKVRLTDRYVLSGSVNVPVNNEGFRAAAVGTLALEYYR